MVHSEWSNVGLTIPVLSILMDIIYKARIQKSRHMAITSLEFTLWLMAVSKPRSLDISSTAINTRVKSKSTCVDIYVSIYIKCEKNHVHFLLPKLKRSTFFENRVRC